MELRRDTRGSPRLAGFKWVEPRNDDRLRKYWRAKTDLTLCYIQLVINLLKVSWAPLLLVSRNGAFNRELGGRVISQQYLVKDDVLL
jgi:hypothetical protein